MKRHRAVTMLLLVTLLLGCTTSTTISTDSEVNYARKFDPTLHPRPEVVNSRLEIISRCCWLRDIHGEWEFELYATATFVDTIRDEFVEIEWDDVWDRDVPEWFAPNPQEYSAWMLKGPSLPIQTLFVERSPASDERIHVYVRRH